MKRNRSASPARHYANDDTDTPEHNPKFQRVDTSSLNDSQLLWCSLGPGCAPPNEPSSFQTIEELEVHYTQCHAYVCNADSCNCIFEREFYLNLHQTEIHDPLAQIRKERGELIYCCLLPECPERMQSPNQRKRHLINDHHFEEKFFFAVIRFGIGDQIRAWGSGTAEPVQTAPKRSEQRKTQDVLKLNDDYAYDGGDSQWQGNQPRRRMPKSSTQSSRAPSSQPLTDSGMEDLTRSMRSTTLVPNSVQFGRGAPRTVPEHTSYQRNASFPDIKMHSDIYSRRSMMSEDEDGGGDDEGEESLEGDEPQLGVRFAEEVAIRFLSPVDRRLGQGHGFSRREKRRAPQGGRRGRRTGGVHSDDESRGRSRNMPVRDTRPGNRGRGGRGGNRGGRTSTERGFRGDGAVY